MLSDCGNILSFVLPKSIVCFYLHQTVFFHSLISSRRWSNTAKNKWENQQLSDSCNTHSRRKGNALFKRNILFDCILFDWTIVQWSSAGGPWAISSLQTHSTIPWSKKLLIELVVVQLREDWVLKKCSESLDPIGSTQETLSDLIFNICCLPPPWKVSVWVHLSACPAKYFINQPM